MASLEIKLAVLAIFLITHGIASWKKWYYKKPSVDTITHFLGGLALSAFVKDWEIRNSPGTIINQSQINNEPEV